MTHRRRHTSARATATLLAVLVAVLVACESSSRDAALRPASASPRAPSSARAVALMVHADSLYPRDYDSARVAFDSAITVARLDGDSVTLARALTSRGNAAWRLGRYDEAQRIGTEALALKQGLHLQRDLAKSYGALGLLAQARGQYEQAELLLRSALAAAQAVNDSAYIARSNGNLGLVHTDLGEFALARTELQTALAMAAARGERTLEVNTAINLGRLELEVGDPTAAVPWLRDARTRSAALSHAVGEENALGQLARADASAGEPAMAIAHLDSALAIARAHGLKEPETDDLELMAELYQSAGQYRRSLVYLLRARALSDSLGMVSKLAHVSLAEAKAYAALGNLPAALGRATAMIDRLRREGARSDELDAELFAAELAQRIGDSASARARLDTASAIAARLGVGVARVRVALARARVLDLAARTNDVVSALRAMAADSALLTADEQAEREGLLARAQLRLGNADSAVAAGRRAVAGVERIRGRMNTGELRTGYTADRATIYADLVLALLQKGAVDEAFRVADAARGRTLTERLTTETRALPTASRRDVAELRELLARIEKLTARLRATDSARTPERGGAGPTLASTLARQLADARREYESRVVRVAQSEPDAAILGATTLDVGDIRRSLATDEALVEFFSIRDRLVTFVVPRDSVQWVSSPVGSDELAERVRSARAVDRGPDVGELEAPACAACAARRTARAGAACSPAYARSSSCRTARSPTCPSRPSRDGMAGRYLVEDYSIVTLASASALPALRRRAASATTAEASILAPLPNELPGSREEAAIVAASYRRDAADRREWGDGGGAALGPRPVGGGPRREPRRVRRPEPDVLGDQARRGERLRPRRRRRADGDARGTRPVGPQSPRLPLRVRDGARALRGRPASSGRRTTSPSPRRSSSPARAMWWRPCGGSRTGARPSSPGRSIGRSPGRRPPKRWRQPSGPSFGRRVTGGRTTGRRTW